MVSPDQIFLYPDRRVTFMCTDRSLCRETLLTRDSYQRDCYIFWKITKNISLAVISLEQGSNRPLFLLAGCTTDIMTSDHSPVFATFEVGVTSQFVSKNGQSGWVHVCHLHLGYRIHCFVYAERKSQFFKSPLKNALSLSPTESDIIFSSSFLDSKYTDSQGEIEFLHCYATLKTKSQTKFYIEFHSSCLESTGLPIFVSVKVFCMFGLVLLLLSLIWKNSYVIIHYNA